MSAKKKISVITLDPRAGISYRSDIAKLFEEVADISVFSMLDGSAAGVLEWADLFVASTDAYGFPEELMRHIPIDSQTMAVEVSFRGSELRKLKGLPAGSRVLFVYGPGGHCPAGAVRHYPHPLDSLLPRRAGGSGRPHRCDAG